MRRLLGVLFVFAAVDFVLLAPRAVAQTQEPLYKIEKDKIEGTSDDRIYVSRRSDLPNNPLYITVQFKIAWADERRAGESPPDVPKDEIKITENRRPITKLEIHAPASREALTTVLAMDISGSMAAPGKMEKSKQAANLFLDKLDAKTKCGLILFDHRLRSLERPGNNRLLLKDLIGRTQPLGGTAYLDATAEAVRMVRQAGGRRAVLVMTDGVDLNSQRNLKEVVQLARAAEVPVYTIGVGEPGTKTPVSTVMVLDRSGSMDDPAEEGDEVSKMEALHQAAGRFVDIMRPEARTTLLPFSDEVETPRPFSADKAALKRAIRQLEAGGQTALFDATYSAVETLVAARPQGKRAVVVLTDGMDNRSRRRVDDVIEAARAAEVPLYMLGLGRKGELDERVMRDMAEQTGGKYYHARNKQALFEIFETLSSLLHDDGIDEDTLKQLAEQTGGKYKQAKDISELESIYGALASELQNTYTVTFPSLRQDDDGTSRDIDISVERGGIRLSNVLRTPYNRPGVVVPEMDHQVYLGLLAIIASLLLLPAGLRRMTKSHPDPIS
jgi:VWFA-related protein